MFEVGLTDFVMLQAGHEGAAAAERGLDLLARVRAEHPGVPVINTEVCYEGIMGSNWQDLQRFAYWTHLLGGAAGHSYGAHPVWAFDEDPATALGRHWASGTWREAVAYPGAAHLGLGRRLAEAWGRLEPEPGLVDPVATGSHRALPCAARAETGAVVVYLPSPATVTSSQYVRELTLRAIGEATWIDPRTGQRRACRAGVRDGQLHLVADGMTVAPSLEDWLLVVEPD